MSCRRLFAALVLSVSAAAPLTAGATIKILNGNQPGEGFNDTTPATPVGGNPGTTLGEQRLNAFQYAADLWGALLDSDVEINIQASFVPLDCTASSGTLGAAGPTRAISDFAGAPLPGVWYPIALANRIAGTDLVSGASQIKAQFNSNVGAANCLSGTGWYYGFDNQHGDLIDLVSTLLHEFAHGLGFLTFVDSSTGEEFQGQPDIFEKHIFDLATGKRWDALTAAERRASTVSGNGVMFEGVAVQAAVPETLSPMPVLTVTTPRSIAGDYSIGTASFGPPLSSGSVAGPLVAALDPSDTAGSATTDACSALTNPSEIAGKVALVDRGTCLFVDKARRVQAAGATAMVVVNNVAGTSALLMGGSAPDVTIPSVSLTKQDGDELRSRLSEGVHVELRINPRRHSGSGLDDRMLLYAPSPVEVGSSTSHWDTSAVPHLLMQPSLSSGLPHEVDLTLPFMRDIGWSSDAVPPSEDRAGVTRPAQPSDSPRAVSQRP